MEKQGRRRAEIKEEEERRERTATTAQLMAMQADFAREAEVEKANRNAAEMQRALELQVMWCAVLCCCALLCVVF